MLDQDHYDKIFNLARLKSHHWDNYWITICRWYKIRCTAAIQEFVDNFTQIAKGTGLKINIFKTEMLPQQALEIKLNSVAVKVVNSFKY